MGTSLTPDFWTMFVALLVPAAGVTIVVASALDALAVRLLDRHVPGPPPSAPHASTGRADQVPVGY